MAVSLKFKDFWKQFAIEGKKEGKDVLKGLKEEAEDIGDLYIDVSFYAMYFVYVIVITVALVFVADSLARNENVSDVITSVIAVLFIAMVILPTGLIRIVTRLLHKKKRENDKINGQ